MPFPFAKIFQIHRQCVYTVYMKLITKAIEKALLKAPLYSSEKLDVAPVILKLFNPYGAGTWYVLEGQNQPDGDWLFFGLVELHETELGYFTLSELQSLRKFGKPSIERDLWFEGFAVDKKARKAVPRAS